MASFTSSATCLTHLLKASVTAISTETVYGLPSMIRRSSGVKCSMETNQPKKEKNSTPVFSAVGVMLTAVMSSSPAMALVDERMSTEGTGLPFGLSNNLLGWILLGVFGLIWAVYFNYVSSLDEDDDSGLSL
ncbi:BnaA10g27910D [Brassica napus]|uniref:PSII 6.1 kDa protein n=1 Tax=Brassica napus TaxID=3708 RepID=A0A078IZI2_BRANA|nr:BnaA10g27910D [Brassica napus]